MDGYLVFFQYINELFTGTDELYASSLVDLMIKLHLRPRHSKFLYAYTPNVRTPNTSTHTHTHTHMVHKCGIP